MDEQALIKTLLCASVSHSHHTVLYHCSSLGSFGKLSTCGGDDLFFLLGVGDDVCYHDQEEKVLLKTSLAIKCLSWTTCTIKVCLAIASYI